MRDREISSKLSTQRVSQLLFKKITLFKNCGHFEFSNFCQKCKKHKFASISLTMRDRVILSKYSTQRVSCQITICRSQTILLSSKMAAISNFCPKMQKHKFASVSLTMRDRTISSKFSTHLSNRLLPIFKRFSCP